MDNGNSREPQTQKGIQAQRIVEEAVRKLAAMGNEIFVSFANSAIHRENDDGEAGVEMATRYRDLKQALPEARKPLDNCVKVIDTMAEIKDERAPSEEKHIEFHAAA